MKATRRNEAINPPTNIDARSQRQMYSLLDNKVIKIKLVKPEKVTMIENSLIQAAQQGKLRGKVSE